MPSFVHSIPLYNRNIKVKCKELDFITYKNLTKTIYNNQPENIDAYIDEVLNDLVVNEDVSEFDIIDKFIILGNIRDINISGEFQLQTDCEVTEKKYTINVNLEEVLEILNSINLRKDIDCRSGSTNIKFTLPTSFNIPTVNDTYSSSIQYIKHGDNDPIKIPDYADKSDFLNKLPVSMLAEYRKFLDVQNEILNNTTLFKYKSPHSEQSKLYEYRFSFFDTSSLELLKLLFQEDLLQMYEFEYDLYSICNLPYDVVKNSTFSELQLIYNIEAKRRTEDQPQPEPHAQQ